LYLLPNIKHGLNIISQYFIAIDGSTPVNFLMFQDSNVNKLGEIGFRSLLLKISFYNSSPTTELCNVMEETVTKIEK
jgi:hypothetical protein